MRCLYSAALAAVVIFSLPALAAPCPKDDLGASAKRVTEGRTAVAYRTIPEKIEVGKPFAVEVVACHDGKTAPSRMQIDAGMPMHGHGMNYTPSEKKIAPGHSVFEGLVFHMPGQWSITFDAFDGETRQRIEQKVRIAR